MKESLRALERKELERRLKLRSGALLIVAILLVFIYVLAWMRHRGEWEDLGSTAEKLFRALEQRDIATLDHYELQEERDTLGMSRSKLGALYDWAFSGFSFLESSTLSAQSNSQGFGVLASKTYRDKNSNVIIVSLNIVRTPDGPRSYYSSALFSAGLDRRYGAPFQGRPNELWHTVNAGLRLEKPGLLGIGLKGVYRQFQSNRPYTWDQMERGAAVVLDREKAQLAAK